ncbi:MAG TPA: hypothetical protein VFR67_27775 [Pilimelia sp.]|nr:hypothetical protein [Pilimelia sp.]
MWIELWTERALARDVDVAPREHAEAAAVLSHPDFEAAVRRGFKDLRRPDLLAPTRHGIWADIGAEYERRRPLRQPVA